MIKLVGELADLPTMSDAVAATPCQPFVLRPRKRLIQAGSVGAVAGWMLASVFYSLRFHGGTRVIVIGAGAAVAVGLVGLTSLSLRRVKLTMIGGQLSFTSLLRDRVVLAADGTGQVVKVEVDWGKASGRRSPLWLLINAAGRTVVVLNRHVWDDAQLEGLRDRLGLPIAVVETPKRPAELRKTYPGTIRWWMAHPVVATVLAIVTIAGLVLVLERLVS